MLYNVGSHKVLHDVFVFMLVRKLILTDGFVIENNSLIMYSILYLLKPNTTDTLIAVSDEREDL